MYIIDGIAYAGEKSPVIKVCGVKPLSDFRLWIRFNTNEAKLFDFKPYLNMTAFLPLQDERIFKEVYIDHGILVWNDGDIDISPELVYNKGVAVDTTNIA